MKLDDKALREMWLTAITKPFTQIEEAVADYGRAVRDAAYAEAAEVADGWPKEGGVSSDWDYVARELAKEIRNLIPNKQE